MTRLVYQNFGSTWAVGIYGDNHKEIDEQFNSFWNHGATSGEPNWLSDGFCFFWTTKEKLIHSLKRAAMYYLPMIGEKPNKAKAKVLAQTKFNSMTSEEFPIEKRDYNYY